MNTETENKPDTAAALAACAAGIAYRAAQTWLSKNNKTADPDALAACVLSWTRASVGAALMDARDAIRANMEQAAVMTFQASLALAGIEAAKEAEVQSLTREELTQGDETILIDGKLIKKREWFGGAK